MRSLVVDAFPLSTRRAMLFLELERLHQELLAIGVVCEIWIDGSYLTAKPEPDDIDVIFSAWAADLDAMPVRVQNAILANLDGGKQYSPLIDTYICVRFPSGDARRKSDRTNYWSELWGKGWDNYLTGYAVIKYGETDVGLRLFT